MFRRFKILIVPTLLITALLLIAGCSDEPAPAPVTGVEADAAATLAMVNSAVGTALATAPPAVANVLLPTTAPTATGDPVPTVPPSPTPTDTPVTSGNGASGPATAAVSLNPVAELPTTEVVKVLTPSVVHISTEIAGPAMFNSPLPPSGVGTGVILNPDGHILTNNHVLQMAESITVTLYNGASLPATVVGRDPTTDLAVIKIEDEELQPAILGDSSTLLVGEDVIAIGHALGLSGAATVSKGVVSALERSIDTDQNTTIIDLIQTDASVNPGNSGGPLVNSRAQVIGINTAIIRGGQGIGFAININDAKVVARQLIDQGFVRRGYLGVRPVSLNPLYAAQLGLDPSIEGTLLRMVIPDTAAAEAGLKAGDIILEMGGQAIRNTGELSKFLITHQPGDAVDLVVLRDGDENTLTITLGDRPEPN